jgi:predicted phosphoadenosine phosphosulfate sulfurtransferase
MFPVEEYGNTGVIMGIRAEESMTRYRAVVRREKDNFIIYDNDIWEPDKRKKKGNIYKVYPIYDWKTADVWTAPKKFGWDYNRAYDVMDKAGLTPYQQRCAPPYGAEPLNNLWMFKVCFPELWEKMYNRVPGSSTAALYAKTQLYGFSGLPDKPSELSWEEAIKQEVKKFPAHQRELVAKKIRTYIKIHYKKVSDDITEEPHPETGIGWKYLYMIAIRGDFKSRRLPNAKSRGDILKEYRGESSGKNKSS